MSASTTWEGDGGLRFPVAPGDLWGCGPHRVLVGDIELGATAYALELAGERPALSYVDPPWGAGLHKGFRTKAGLGPLASYDELIYRIMAACAEAPITLVEMGWKDCDHLLATAAEAGLALTGSWEILTYTGKSPCALFGFGDARWPDFSGMDDAETLDVAVGELTAPGALVMDFCMGLGYTAGSAARLGRRFVGNELHPRRASAALTKVERATGVAPELLGNFPELTTSETYQVPNVPDGYVLKPGERPTPVVWCVDTGVRFPAVPTEGLERIFGPGRSRKLKTWGHDEAGVHYIATRNGTYLHQDTTFVRYTHQLVIRNDGGRIRGLVDRESGWHPPMVPGVMDCIDTHSPHQVVRDPRIAGWDDVEVGYKLQIVVDRDEPLTPTEAYALLRPRLREDPLAVDPDAVPFSAQVATRYGVR